MGTMGVVIFPKDRIENKKTLKQYEINKRISKSKEYGYATAFDGYLEVLERKLRKAEYLKKRFMVI